MQQVDTDMFSPFSTHSFTINGVAIFIINDFPFKFSDVPVTDSELRQKLAETQRDLETADRKVKDLQLRLKRFVKDDQVKDEKIAQMEKEKREFAESLSKLEELVAESRNQGNNNERKSNSREGSKSSVCVIL